MTQREARGPLEVSQIYKLIQCVHKNDTEQMELLLQSSGKGVVDLTEPRDGLGLLHVAAKAGNHVMVSFLLSHGANPDVQNKEGVTPAMMAAERGQNKILALLAEHHATMTLQDCKGRGVLFYCAYGTKAHTRSLQTAIEHQADPNNVSAEGLPVLQFMCQRAQQRTTNGLLPDHRADPNTTNGLLLDHRADPNTTNGLLPDHRADPNTTNCLLLLDHGADPNTTNQKTEVTALMEAAKAGSLELVMSILRRGGNPNAVDKNHQTAIHYAAKEGFFEGIVALSAYGADTGVVSLDDCSALHFAAASGNANCCRFLVQRGCDPRLKNLQGLVPRTIAIRSGFKAAAAELRRSEEQLTKPSAEGPLSDAWALSLHDWSSINETELRQAFSAQAQVLPTDTFISVLKELGAPVQIEQLHQVIALHDEAQRGLIDLNDFIKGSKYIQEPYLLSTYAPKKKKEKGEKAKKGKKKDKADPPFPICMMPPELIPRRANGVPEFMIEKYQPQEDGFPGELEEKEYINIIYCVRNRDLKSVDLALRQGTSVDVLDQFYKTPLMEACTNGTFQTVQYLLAKGANVKSSDQFLWTPLHHAALRGQTDIIKLLVEAGADVNAPGRSREIPLMNAIACSRVDAVEHLLEKGSKAGKDCLELAESFGNLRIIDLIQGQMKPLPEPQRAPDQRKGAKKANAKGRAKVSKNK